jgi:hypothetical protein
VPDEAAALKLTVQTLLEVSFLVSPCVPEVFTLLGSRRLAVCLCVPCRMCLLLCMQTVESGAKNIEVAVLRHNQELEFLSTEALEKLEVRVFCILVVLGLFSGLCAALVAGHRRKSRWSKRLPRLGPSPRSLPPRRRSGVVCSTVPAWPLQPLHGPLKAHLGHVRVMQVTSLHRAD